MYYKIEGRTVVLDTHGNNHQQDFDPRNGNPFKSKEEQINWVEDYVLGGAERLKVDISFSDIEGEPIDALSKGVLGNIIIDTDTESNYTLGASIRSKKDDSFELNSILSFESGKAIQELELDKKGEYYIILDCDKAENLEKPVLHELYEYNFYVRD